MIFMKNQSKSKAPSLLIHFEYYHMMKKITDEIFDENRKQNKNISAICSQSQLNLEKTSIYSLRTLFKMADFLGKRIKITLVDKD